MNSKFQITLALVFVASSLMLTACSSVPFEPSISEGKFRFENFRRINKTRTDEYVTLMCLNNKPTGWQEPMQFEAGEQIIWVHARTYQEGIENSKLEAFLRFDINLEADKSYMLNRLAADGDIMTIWIQEVKTGISASEKVTVQLERPAIYEHNLRDTQCAAGTI